MQRSASTPVIAVVLPCMPRHALAFAAPLSLTAPPRLLAASASRRLPALPPHRHYRRAAPLPPTRNTRPFRPFSAAPRANLSAALHDAIAPTMPNAPDTRTVLATRVMAAMQAAYGEEHAADPKLTAATRPDFGDYQCNAAMSLSKKLKLKPRDVAAAILTHLDVSDVCDVPQVAGPGFINLTLSDAFVSAKLNNMLADRDRLGVAKRSPPQRVIVDFSSPNIAKDMHVGHLRSTIIGDTLARTLEFLGHDTLRLNHVGDWGTQFGQLITYMRAEEPELLKLSDDAEADSALAAAKIGDLVQFYRKAKARFDEDPDFKQAALDEVVELQNGNEETLRAWKLICALSRIEFQRIYDRLDINLVERGESFYNPYLGDLVQLLDDKNITSVDNGATVVFLEGKEFLGRDGKSVPAIVRKTNGSYLYPTTDLAAIRYRADVDKAERILYVTDVGQAFHFKQVFAVSRMAKTLGDNVELVHVPFGLVLGEDGKKFKTRKGDAPKLSELLDESRDRVREELLKRKAEETQKAEEEGKEAPEPFDPERLEYMSEVIGIAAVKYADLKSNRNSNYKFSFDKMVKLEGDTAPYMLYAFARVQGIYRTAAAAYGGEEADQLTEVGFLFEKSEEKMVARQLLRLPEVLDELERELMPHVLCDYVKGLTSRFNQFYEQCPVLQAESAELKRSRLALCQLSADTLKMCLGLLGIPTLDRI